MIDCQKCGACCQALPHFDRDTYVMLTGEELTLLKKVNPELVMTFAQPYYGMPGGLKMCNRRCSALKGQVGKQVSCQVYKDRPKTCRDFEPGSEYCILAREEAGLSPYDD